MSHPNVRTKPSAGPVTDYSSTTASGNKTIISAENPSRAYLAFQNNSDTTMYLYLGDGAPSDTNSLKVNAGGSVTFNGSWVPSSPVKVRCSSASKAYACYEGV
jgi:hypothetical protein